MRNPRRIILDEASIKKHKLSTSPPPAGSLFWKMWDSCTHIAEQALKTDFIQGIKAGNLDPVKFGGFNVSDAYYCFDGAQDYSDAGNRAQDEALKALLHLKHLRYLKHNKELPQIWRVKDAGGVVPFDVLKKYSEFESKIVSRENPVYCIVVMLPCDYLWYWLANQCAPPVPGNLYAPWITGNNDPGGAYAMGNFLELFQEKYPGIIDENKAIRVYSEAMTYEQLNFAAATE